MIFGSDCSIEENIILIEKELSSPKIRLALSDPSLETGSLGLFLFYLFFSRYKSDHSYRNIAVRFLEYTLENINLKKFTKTHKLDSAGARLSGLGRTIEFVKRNGLAKIDSAGLHERLTYLLEIFMSVKINSGDFNELSGALSAGSYFMYLADQGQRYRDNLSKIVDGIYNHAKIDNNGNFYWQAPSLDRRVFLGIHGSASIILFLSKLYSKGIRTDLCEEILRKAIAFVFSNKFFFKNGIFPIAMTIDNGIINSVIQPNQFNQCYGDLSVLYSLMEGAYALNDFFLKREAERLVETSYCFDRRNNLVLDSSINYGAAGVANIYKRLFYLSKDKALDERWRYWYKSIITYGSESEGILGYGSAMSKDATYPAKTKLAWNSCFSLGITGIGIALISFSDTSGDVPEIDDLTVVR